MLSDQASRACRGPDRVEDSQGRHPHRGQSCGGVGMASRGYTLRAAGLDCGNLAKRSRGDERGPTVALPLSLRFGGFDLHMRCRSGRRGGWPSASLSACQRQVAGSRGVLPPGGSPARYPSSLRTGSPRLPHFAVGGQGGEANAPFRYPRPGLRSTKRQASASGSFGPRPAPRARAARRPRRPDGPSPAAFSPRGRSGLPRRNLGTAALSVGGSAGAPSFRLQPEQKTSHPVPPSAGAGRPPRASPTALSGSAAEPPSRAPDVEARNHHLNGEMNFCMARRRDRQGERPRPASVELCV
jgi:hypothetical protein